MRHQHLPSSRSAKRGAKAPTLFCRSKGKRTGFLYGGILLVLSFSLLTNICLVGLVKEETWFDKNPKTFVRQKQKRNEQPSLGEGGGLPDTRRIEEHDVVFDQTEEPEKRIASPSQVSSLNSLMPHRQLQDDNVEVESVPVKQDDPAEKNSRAYFIKKGNQFYVTSRDALDLHESLPAQTYTIGRSLEGFFLQTIDSFEIHGKIYGDTKRQASRILKTFLHRSGSTGVLLSGEKGSGKTFLAKYIAIQAAQQHKIPTVVVNQPLSGERFNTFIQSIQQPTVFLFDEFEKVYGGHGAQVDQDAMEMEMEMMRMDEDSEGRPEINNMGSSSQDEMLTLLDGTYTTKMLFILTTNNKYGVSTNMRNRPGRIFYVIDFYGLSTDFVKEYCTDNLADKTKIPQMVAVAGLFEAFNFDMLQAMVEEMNRYGEAPEQVLDFLNVRPEFTRGSQYLVKLTVGGDDIPQYDIRSGRQWYGNPLVHSVFIEYKKPRSKKKRVEDTPQTEPKKAVDQELNATSNPEGDAEADADEELTDDAVYEEMRDYRGRRSERSGQIEFTANDIDRMDATAGSFSYWNEKQKARLILTKHGATMKSGHTPGSLLQKISQLQALGGSTGAE